MAPPADRTILVVEDHDETRSALVKLLTMAGCTVLDAANGAEALELLQEQADIDLILADVSMPGGISGVELLERVREIAPGTPGLLMTGHPRESVAIPDGVRLLRKPFRKQDLDEAVEELLGPG